MKGRSVMRKIIVGSRKSKLALTQTNWFINQLKEAGVPFEFEIKASRASSRGGIQPMTKPSGNTAGISFIE